MDKHNNISKKPFQKSGLGKGLAELLGRGFDGSPQNNYAFSKESLSETPQNLAENVAKIYKLLLTNISANRYQPRKNINEDSIAELAESIKENGLIQPIIVRKLASSGQASYEIIAGERRFRALKYLGASEIDAIILEATDAQIMEFAIVENIQREDMHPIDEALAFKNLADFGNYRHEEIARKVGKSRSYITNSLRMLNLPQEVQDFIAQGKLSTGHAKLLIGHAQAVELAEYCIAKGLSVRALEQEIINLEERLEEASSAEIIPEGSYNDSFYEVNLPETSDNESISIQEIYNQNSLKSDKKPPKIAKDILINEWLSNVEENWASSYNIPTTLKFRGKKIQMTLTFSSKKELDSFIDNLKH